MSETVLFEQREQIVVLTLNVASTRNALAGDVLERLIQRFEQAANDVSCRAVVLTGGKEFFSSGGDMNNMKEERTLTVARERVGLSGKLARAMLQNPKPIVVAVEGFAAGGGFSLAMGADYVVASREAKFIAAFSKVGLMPDVGMLWSLVQRIGLGKAKHIIASSRRVDAEEALKLGIADKLVVPGTATEEAIKVAEEFTAGAPLPIAMMKQVYARGVPGLDDALQFEMDAQSSLYLTKDHREAVTAFLEKRAVKFTGH